MKLENIAGLALWIIVGLICAYLVLPTLVIIPISFTDLDYISFPPERYSFRWYETFFSEAAWRNSTINSVIVGLISAFLSTVIGTLAAMGVRTLNPRGAKLVIILMMLPMIIPGIIIAVGLYGMFASLGIIGTYIGLVLAHMIITLPFVFVCVSSIMQKIDWRIVDAARSLGAGPIRTFFKVTFPALSPGILSGAVFAFLISFDEVVVALFLTSFSMTTLPVQMWNGIRFEISPAVAAAATIMLILSLILLALYSGINYLANRRQPSDQ